jgi:glycerophosphoryl diester phosphodiesterase
MPTLASVFELARPAPGVRFNIETKISPLAPHEAPPPRAFVEALVATLLRDASIAARVTIQSFDWRTLLIVQQIEPRLATSYLTADEYEGADSPWTAGFRLHRHGSLPRRSVLRRAPMQPGRPIFAA